MWNEKQSSDFFKKSLIRQLSREIKRNLTIFRRLFKISFQKSRI